uniref:G-protein coupled receptors family 3 profile domain-containing protein n=1 Tax=Xenopus tropicalis TaxID=8364 RepID=A0A6I8S0X8_XENTR
MWHVGAPMGTYPHMIYHFNTFTSLYALIFAVDEINSDPDLLPNITLGYHIFDTCITVRRSAQGALWMLSGGQEITLNYHCYQEAPLAGIIGDCGSTRSILMAEMNNINFICLSTTLKQISYFATSPVLNNRDQFPSFFRTIPSDEFQMRGLAELVSYFDWTWVGLLANDDDYGQFGMQMVKQEVLISGGCFAFIENILTGLPNRNAPHLAQVIRESSAKVVLVISSDSDFVIVLEELIRQNATGTIWVGSEGWANSALLSDERFQQVLVGAVGFSIHGGQLPKFTKYLKSLHPFKDSHDAFVREFWEEAFLCKWLTQKNATEFSSLNVYTAVYAMAQALHNLHQCTPGTGPFLNGSCANISSLRPWQLLHYVKNVNFKTKDGGQVSFDATGNPPAVYDVVNWRASVGGKMDQIVVGSYDLNSANGKTLNVERDSIIWSNRDTQAPISKCSPSCLSGFRKVIVPGKPLCCYECARCPQGQISNITDAAECNPCSWDTWPNLQQDRCLPRPTEFLSYGDPLGYSLAAISIFSSLIPLIILAVFIHQKKTPIVRANNYSLSCLLLLSLFLCFLCSLGFIGYPQPEKCLLRQVAFGMVFALCISCVLAKTITVVIAFNATKPGSSLRKWTGIRVSYCLILLCALNQLTICGIWLIFFPPFYELDTDTKPGIIILNCNEGSPFAFWCMLGYLGLLASISFIVAFLARRLPDSFNEAKLITFSMLAFLSVWVSFIPAYLSARGMYTVAMEVFAILSSSWAVVGCIFVPKCYIVLFRPNMNSREHLMVKGRGTVLLLQRKGNHLTIK